MSPLAIPRKNSQIIYLQSDDYKFVDGDILYFTIKTKPDSDATDADALLKKNWTVGTDATYDEEGYLQLKLDATDTDIECGNYVFDIKLVNSEVSETLVFGDINILPVATLRA